MRTRDIFVNGLGTYLPELVAAPAVVEGGMTGAAVAGDLPSVTMALHATRQALARSALAVCDFRLLLQVEIYHSGPDGWSPPSYLQRYVFGGDLLAAGLRQGCNGVFGAMELAAGYLGAVGGSAAAMIVAADNLQSPLLDRWTAITGYCMGDGATALVLSRAPGFARLKSVTSSTVAELEELHRGNEPLHPSSLVAGRRTDFQGRADDFLASGKYSHDVVMRLLKTTREVVFRALDEAAVTVSDVTRMAAFNGPKADLEVYLAALGLPITVTSWEYGRALGHSANDHLLAFDHLLATGGLAPGDHLLMFGVGPGLTLAAAVLEIIERPAWT
jgi:3-oxoacyl-[acyl-carrier-protein] synthase-3